MLSSVIFTATDEQRLRDEFGQFGTITDVFLPMDRNTQRPRGFGFVTFSTRDAAEKAISKMDQAQVDGRTLRVNESRPKGQGPGRGFGAGAGGGFNAAGADEVKLYVGNLSFDTPEEAVRRLFEQHGAVTDCFCPTDRDTGRPRGFAFITMSAAEAEKACNSVNGQELDGRTLRVNEAQPKGSGPGRGGGRGGAHNCEHSFCIAHSNFSYPLFLFTPILQYLGYGGGGGYDDYRGGGGGYGVSAICGFLWIDSNRTDFS